MNRNQKRLALSFLLSMACVGATHLWYKSSSSLAVDYGDRKPIARLIESVNEVQRKPLKRLIWQSLSDNDSLFGGEQIRTTATSEARIEIIKTGAIISLEPESLITLEDNNGELSLDFLKGNLFVKGGGGDLKLKTGGKELSLTGENVALNKGASGQVEVLSGANDPFQILGPAPQAEIHVGLEGKDRVQFEWARALAANANVVLEVGKTRSDLKAQTDLVKSQGKVSTVLAPGDYFWRLVSEDPTQPGKPMVSFVYRLKVLPKRPPIPLFPERDFALATPEGDTKVIFRWANPGKLGSPIVEVAESEDLKKGVIREESKNKDSLEVTLPKSGTYFWRVTGFIGQKREPVTSAIYKFSLVAGGDVTSPVLEFPTKGDKVSFQQMREKGLALQWKPVAGAKTYRLTLREKASRAAASEPRLESVPVHQLRLSDLKPGQYEWSVTAIAVDGKESRNSEVWTFAVEETPMLAWKDSHEQYAYLSKDPELALEWLAGPKGTSSYRLKVRSPEETSEAPVASSVEGTLGKVSVKADGRYVASVEALNKDGQVLARSNERTVEVKPSPLLPAPQFDVSLPSPLRASRNGGLDVGWSPVDGAKGYVIEVTDADGNSLKEESTASQKTQLRKLKPGDLRVQIRAVDVHGRRGLASEARPVLVPDTSDVRAPKMKQIRVE